MNLVKAQAIANDLSPEMLQKYANGFDPRIIPPWLATGTLQAKMDLNKRMQNMMGGSQEEQPSIKEQIEQKAGLLAANAMQQQMAPRPAPVGTPQPQAQMMMARGGLASVPVNFAFKPGGIVGYSIGGDTMGTPSLSDQELTSQAADIATEDRKKEIIIDKIKELNYRAKQLESVDPEMAVEVRTQIADLAAVLKPAKPVASRPASVSEAQATAAAGPQAAVPPRQIERQVPRPEAPRPAAQPAQTGLPAAANRSKYFDLAESEINKPIAAPTTASILAEQKALSPQAMQEETMKQRYEERKGRADKERALFDKTRPTGLDDAIRIFGQSGQFKGGTGFAPAYTANQERKRAEELGMEKRMNDLYTAADTQEYEGSKEIYSARAGAMKEANRSYQERLKGRTDTLASLANTDQRSIDAALARLTEMQLQQMRMAQSKADAARPGEGERFAAKYLGMIAANDLKGAEAYKDAYLLGKKGEPKEDTFAKESIKRRIEIASSVMPQETKAAQLAGLEALERQQGGGAGKLPQPGKVVDFSSLPK